MTCKITVGPVKNEIYLLFRTSKNLALRFRGLFLFKYRFDMHVFPSYQYVLFSF